jgi:uncharacterized membrane protein
MIFSHSIVGAVARRPGLALPWGWAAILPLVLFAVLLALLIIKMYRERQDILDVEDPDSPEDLLRSFELAHRAGELDDDEFERVKQQLARDLPGKFVPNPEAAQVAELVRRRLAESDNDPGPAAANQHEDVSLPSGPTADDARRTQ